MIFHFTTTGVELTKKQADMIKGFLAKGMYDDVFVLPKQKLVYRGMAVSKQFFNKVVGKDHKDKGRKKVNFTFTPKIGATSSWSTGKKVAKHFAGDAYEDALVKSDIDLVPIILTANVAENQNSFVSGPGGLYKIEDLTEHKDEKEVIGGK